MGQWGSLYWNKGGLEPAETVQIAQSAGPNVNGSNGFRCHRLGLDLLDKAQRPSHSLHILTVVKISPLELER